MAKDKFCFNPNTLSFDKIKKSKRQLILPYVAYCIYFIAAAIIINIVFTYYFETPKIKQLKREYEQVMLKYEMLEKQIDHVYISLKDIQQRDDQIFRPIFELDPIPSSIREAGFGGINRYDKYEDVKESELVIDVSRMIDKITKQVYVQSKSYDKIIEHSRNKDKMLASLPAIQPIAIKDLGRISSYYGWRVDPFTKRSKFHDGMDFTGAVGTEVYATGNGTVEYAKYSRYGYGNDIVINHAFGYKTRYAHLNNLLVEKGDVVKRGQVIGHLGNTGRSTGPHLHYEVIKNNKPVNPINFYFNDISPEQYELMVRYSARKGGETMD